MKAARLDRLGDDSAVRRDGHHHFLRLVGDDGGCGYQEGLSRAAGRDAQTRELPRRDGEVRIGDRRAGMDCPAAAVHGVVDKVERAVTVEISISCQADGDVVMRPGAVVSLLIG